MFSKPINNTGNWEGTRPKHVTSSYKTSSSEMACNTMSCLKWFPTFLCSTQQTSRYKLLKVFFLSSCIYIYIYIYIYSRCTVSGSLTADHPGGCPGQNILEIKNLGHWPHLVGKGEEEDCIRILFALYYFTHPPSSYISTCLKRVLHIQIWWICI